MTRASAIQMCSSLSIDDNLKSAGHLLRVAADQGARLAVLPEMFPIISTNAQDKIKYQEDVGSGKIQNFLQTQAQTLNLWIVGGTMPLRSAQGNRVRAASLVYDANGAVAARYDKLHLFDVDLENKESHRESANTEPGDHLVVVDTPIGKLGLSVCYDLRFPAMFNYLFHQGAEIFAIPSAFTVPTGSAHWHLLTRARAVENFSYVMGACQGGTHESGRQTYGHSLIVDPWGTIIAEQQENQPGVITADIDLDFLRKIRASIPIEKHHRIIPDISQI